jgi:site-specific recombinase XerD
VNRRQAASEANVIVRFWRFSSDAACGGLNWLDSKTEDFQVREEHCVIADLVGKGKHIRTVPVPIWAKRAVDEWMTAADTRNGAIFRRLSRLDKIWGAGITPKAIWHVVKAPANRADIKNLAPHDLRRTSARLCHLAGGELEQIQFLLGHASVQTTERYLGCKQN